MKLSSAAKVTESVTNMVQISTCARAAATELGGDKNIDHAIMRAENLLDSVFGDRVTEDERRAFISLCVAESAFSWVDGYTAGHHGSSEEDLGRALKAMDEIEKQCKRRDERLRAALSEDQEEKDLSAIIDARSRKSALMRLVRRIRMRLSGGHR
ncbi:MAG: hypothetical protein OXD33_10745 [Rhodobacteraceae bacterium]|nr:hypothetical protein [Paracoccaceae bacterium]